MADPEVQLGSVFFTLETVDRAGQFNNLTPMVERAKVEAGRYGSSMEKNLPGLFSADLTSSFRPDSDGVFVAELWGYFYAGTSITMVLRGTTAAKSISNPQITMTGFILAGPPLMAKRGDLVEGDLKFAINTVTYDDGTNVYALS